jgi:hypothetical protein
LIREPGSAKLSGMKTLGRTNEGGFLVELTHAEHEEFSRLHLACTGSIAPLSHSHDRRGIEYDFEGTFGAIRAFYESKFRVNEWRELLDQFEKYF